MHKIILDPNDGAIIDMTVYGQTSIVLGDYSDETSTFTERLNNTCRDVLVHVYNRWACKVKINNCGYYDSHAFKQNPFNRTVFGIMVPEMSKVDANKAITTILNLLHPFERARHWKRTKITYNVKTQPAIDDKCKFFLVVGSKCWVTNPIFLYIYLSVFKAYFHNVGDAMKKMCKMESLQDLFDYLESRSDTSKGVLHQYSNASLWLDLIRSRKKIFKGFSTEALATRVWQHGKSPQATYGLGPFSLLSHTREWKGIKTKHGKTLGGQITKWKKVHRKST